MLPADKSGSNFTTTAKLSSAIKKILKIHVIRVN